jgi:hypothetical protein
MTADEKKKNNTRLTRIELIYPQFKTRRKIDGKANDTKERMAALFMG